MITTTHSHKPWTDKGGHVIGAYLIHIPLLAGTMLTSYSLGEETSGCLD